MSDERKKRTGTAGNPPFIIHHSAFIIDNKRPARPKALTRFLTGPTIPRALALRAGVTARCIIRREAAAVHSQGREPLEPERGPNRFPSPDGAKERHTNDVSIEFAGDRPRIDERSPLAGLANCLGLHVPGADAPGY